MQSEIPATDQSTAGTEQPSVAAEPKPVYILITQCLQNNFFLSRDNSLKLEEDQALKMLLKDRDAIDRYVEREGNRRTINIPSNPIAGAMTSGRSRNPLEEGPLYQFFHATLNDPNRANDLHVIHIKDWHRPSESYNRERKRYGSHCEAGTWEAQPIDGFDQFLQPWPHRQILAEPPGQGEQQTLAGFQKGKTTHYEILSNTIHDFLPAKTEEERFGLQLDEVLDKLIVESGADKNKVFIVVIGVLTDIKIKLLLTNLRSRYDVPNIVMSDVLTASNTLERHLSGLDFADKVLNVEIIHSLNALASVLNPYHDDDIPMDTIEGRPDFRNYRSYYLDKQNVLSFQDQKLAGYIELTGRRGAQAYETIFSANRWLIMYGTASLFLTIVFALLAVLRDESQVITGAIAALFGGLGLAQFSLVFFARPAAYIQENLNNLVRLRNYLETYSTTSALLRHHLTTPELLQDDTPEDGEHTVQERRMAYLEKQLNIVQEMARKLSRNFDDITLRGNKQSNASDQTGRSEWR